MANPEHLQAIKQGAWNKWKRDNLGVEPDLDNADLRGLDLRRANLVRASLSNADLRGTQACDAHLSESQLFFTKAANANFSRAGFQGARVEYSCLRDADLHRADFTGALLRDVDMKRCRLNNAVFCNTVFVDCDMSDVSGLDSSVHFGPSAVDHQTLLKSGPLPPQFLRGCGFPESFVDNAHSIFWQQPLAYYSCFISYSHADQEFASRVHGMLQARGIRCWLDKKELTPGDDIYEEVDRGIRHRDKVLLCCSKSSLNSWWVDNEIGTTIDEEQRLTSKQGVQVRKLVPLNLDGFLFSAEWTGGYVSQIRRRLAADFTGWRTSEGKFEREMEQVVKALRVTPQAGGPGT